MTSCWQEDTRGPHVATGHVETARLGDWAQECRCAAAGFAARAGGRPRGPRLSGQASVDGPDATASRSANRNLALRDPRHVSARAGAGAGCSRSNTVWIHGHVATGQAFVNCARNCARSRARSFRANGQRHPAVSNLQRRSGGSAQIALRSVRTRPRCGSPPTGARSARSPACRRCRRRAARRRRPSERPSRQRRS